MVNGRAFSGTGVGYNPARCAGQPRLTAYENIQMARRQPFIRPCA